MAKYESNGMQSGCKCFLNVICKNVNQIQKPVHKILTKKNINNFLMLL